MSRHDWTPEARERVSHAWGGSPEVIAIDRLYECPVCGSLRFEQTVLVDSTASSLLVSTERPYCKGQPDRPHQDFRPMTLAHTTITRWADEH